MALTAKGKIMKEIGESARRMREVQASAKAKRVVELNPEPSTPTQRLGNFIKDRLFEREPKG